MKRSTILVTALTLWAAVASAAEPKPFTQQDFDKLTHDGKPVVVDVTAAYFGERAHPFRSIAPTCA